MDSYCEVNVDMFLGGLRCAQCHRRIHDIQMLSIVGKKFPNDQILVPVHYFCGCTYRKLNHGGL